MGAEGRIATIVAALHRAEVPRRVNQQLTGGVRGVWVGHWRRSPDAPLHSLALPARPIFGPFVVRSVWPGLGVGAVRVSVAAACGVVGAAALLDGLSLLLARLVYQLPLDDVATRQQLVALALQSEAGR